MLHDTGELTCPRCGASLAGVRGDESMTGDANEQIRTPITCPECEASPHLVVESALPEALGVDVFVEDAHHETGGDRR